MNPTYVIAIDLECGEWFVWMFKREYVVFLSRSFAEHAEDRRCGLTWDHVEMLSRRVDELMGE